MFTDHMPITCRPHTDHIPTTYWPHTDHLYQPHTNRPHTDRRLYRPHTHHMPTTHRPHTNRPYRPHTDQINLFTIAVCVSGDFLGGSERRTAFAAEESSVEQKDEDQLSQSGEIGNLVKKVEQGTAPINTNLSQLGKVTDEIVAAAEQEKLFDLLCDGGCLKLPGKYRKIKKQNAKLNSQLRNARRSQSVSQSRFVECLETTFDLATSTTHARLYEEASQLVTWHERLVRLVSAAVGESQGLVTGASFSWQQAYKAYRLWQLALNRFDELHRRTQQLLQGRNLFTVG